MCPAGPPGRSVRMDVESPSCGFSHYPLVAELSLCKFQPKTSTAITYARQDETEYLHQGFPLHFPFAGKRRYPHRAALKCVGLATHPARTPSWTRTSSTTSSWRCLAPRSTSESLEVFLLPQGVPKRAPRSDYRLSMCTVQRWEQVEGHATLLPLPLPECHCMVTPRWLSRSSWHSLDGKK